ncbi:hypothetical protein [Vibrio sagamiensis]|uniref:Uncharacterized protein n=1 Tax=Vibrio sagamiensis NBRC 104589 TaxID=1219064 RepID=A0A511QIQ3_9VIBR|nr:hypothetical protein [Vibrio sagamiensis]PNQ69014.1 hypothetical protein C1141_06405 [Vibrio agarivorans]GEM77183.1 hypothetical protein VSA01S_32950 [Vibrio sagamiensis NBRC 104589]
MTEFESAQGLIRQSIQRCFGRAMVVVTPQGQEIEVIGYIRSYEKGVNQVHLLATDSELPECCTLLYRDKHYKLVFDAAVKSPRSTSQLMREYVMVLDTRGTKHQWSEF